MVDPTGITHLAGLLDDANNYFEYWRQYRGEEIVIREHKTISDEEYSNWVQQRVYVIRGTVKKVMSMPPGFLLESVTESIVFSDGKATWTANESEMHSFRPGAKGEQVLREVDEKFVSFSSINQLETADVADNAKEPFRE